MVSLEYMNKRKECVAMNTSDNRGRLVILRGYPGSGKSTLSREIMSESATNGTNAVIVSLDAFRVALAGSKLKWQEMCDTGNRSIMESIVAGLAHDARSRFLDLGFTVISDATHLHYRTVAEEIAQAIRHDADVEVHDVGVHLDFDDLIERNENRNDDDVIPVGVLKSMWDRNDGRKAFTANAIELGIEYGEKSSWVLDLSDTVMVTRMDSRHTGEPIRESYSITKHW